MDSTQEVSTTSQGILCDAACKQVLTSKSILARIMKSCLAEYKECDLDTIENTLIEGKPELSRDPVFPKDATSVICGIDTADKSQLEGDVFYDICFHAKLPNSEEQIGLIINIEAQNDASPGYPLIKRGLYYCARLISSQHGKTFTKSHYGDIKKVYSVWICMSAPKCKENTITNYAIAENQVIGCAHEPPENYDMLSVIIVHLGDPDKVTDDGILRMLDVIFTTDKNAKDKLQILQDEFDIKITPKFESEVTNMCNVSEGFEAKGMAKGMEKGMAQGMTKGKVESIEALMKSMEFSPTEAMDALLIPESEQQKYLDLIKPHCA